MRQSWTFALHAAVLICIYSCYGLLQEKILKGVHDVYGARFTSAPLLVLCNRCFSLVVGLALSLAVPSQSSDSRTRTNGKALPAASSRPLDRLRPKSPLYAYAAVAVFNFAATFCQYEALRHVSFTTQTLAKCSKMIPVLLVGTILYRKRYSLREWTAAVVVAFGCALYLLSSTSGQPSSGPSQPKDASIASPPIVPIFLLSGYLLFDGLTSTTQEKLLRKAAKGTSPLTPGGPVLEQMVYVNLLSAVVSLLTASQQMSKMSGSVDLLLKTPHLQRDVLLLSATATIGQLVLFDTIAKFGALSLAMIMTCRQFFSILLNAGVFKNTASIPRHAWYGVGLVAAGVYIKMSKAAPRKSSTVARSKGGRSVIGGLGSYSSMADWLKSET